MADSTIVELTDTKFNEHVDGIVSEKRIDGMMRKMKTTEEKIAYLEKVKGRWSRAYISHYSYECSS